MGVALEDGAHGLFIAQEAIADVAFGHEAVVEVVAEEGQEDDTFDYD